MTQPAMVQGKQLIGPISLSDERWREYDWNGRVYRIDNPVALYYRDGGSTHRVLDAQGVTHCVPAPTHDATVVLRWSSAVGVSF